MKQYIKNIMLVFVSVGILASCSNYLEETDPNNLSSDTFWRNLNDAEKGLTATYATLMNHFILNIAEEACRSDMGWPGYGRPAPNGKAPVDYYYQTYNSTTEEVERKWQALYLGIFRANQVIKGLNKIKVQTTEEQMEEWHAKMGQARFLRGLFHFYLYQTYNNGSVVIRDDVPVTLEDFNKGLSPAKDVLEFVQNDLRYAHNNLPPKATTDYVLGRATAGSAATVLGNSFLFEANYDSAMYYYDDVMNNEEYGYKIVKDLSQMFTIEGENNDESIFEISYNTEFRTELSTWDEASLHSRWATRTAGSTGSFTPTWLAYTYKTEAMDPLFRENYYTNESGLEVLRNVPHRASAMVTLVEDEQTRHYDGTATSKGVYSWNGWGFSRPKKYTNHDHLNDESDSGESGWNSEKNVILNRLSEVYINMAECLLKIDGDVSGAIKLINEIRGRWGLVLLGESNGDITRTYDEIIYSADELMDRIMYIEKPLELSNEGHLIRWVDMRRWGITSEIFEKLSQETYYAIDYSYIDETGKAKTIGRASLVKAIPPGYTGAQAKIDYEYKQTTNNYNSSAHDYFAIPSNETTANSEVNE